MFNYFTTKNAENIRYEISVLKNTNLSNTELEQINNAESYLYYSKSISRVYIALEIFNLAYFIYMRRKGESGMKKSNLMWKMALAYMRVNLFWLIMNYATNYYIDRFTNIRKIINKYKAKNSNVQFKQFIEHKL